MPTHVVVLYRDMRTYGFREAAYREARKKRGSRLSATSRSNRRNWKSTGDCNCGSAKLGVGVATWN